MSVGRSMNVVGEEVKVCIRIPQRFGYKAFVNRFDRV